MEEPPTDPSVRLHPRTPPVVVVVGVIAVVVAVVLVILNLGGSDDAAERRGDLTYIEGTASRQPRGGESQLAASIADLISAEVAAGDPATLVFTAQVASSAPRSLKSSALEFRWQLDGDDGSVWTLTVSIARDARVALFSDGGHGSGTIDDTLPGDVVIEDDAVSVRLEPSAIEDFPAAFDWNLATTLRAFRNETDSPRVEDRFPDEGTERFEL